MTTENNELSDLVKTLDGKWTISSLIDAMKSDADDNISTLEVDDHSVDEGLLYFSIRAEASIFESETDQTNALTMSSEMYRYLQYGRGIWNGIHYVHLTENKSYGQYVDLPDENDINVWFGPLQTIEAALPALKKKHDEALLSETMSDISAAARMIQNYTGQANESFSAENIKKDIANIMRKLCT